MRPRLEAVFFGDGQYPRLARALALSAQRHCPGWDVNVRRIDPHVRAASGNEADAANHHKLCEWRRLVEGAHDGARILLVDADTFVTAPLDSLWEREFDLAYTVRDASRSRFPLNAGVVAVRVGPATRRFMDAWSERDAAFLRDIEARGPWRQRYGGQNQASLGAILESGLAAALGLKVATLPCLEWNAEDTSWERFNPAVTKIVHVKGALRMAVFGIASSQHVRPLARMWRDLDTQLTEAVA